MADVIPAPMAIAMNAGFRPCRFGRPKLMLEAPQVVLTFNSVRRRRIRLMTCTPASAIAPTGITNGSTTTSQAGMP